MRITKLVSIVLFGLLSTSALALEAKPRLSPEEELEEHRLKKMKLRLKDQMNAIVSRHRAQNVA